MFYKDEAQRQKAITKIVDEAIGEKGEWGRVLGWADNIKPDSCCQLMVLRVSHPGPGVQEHAGPVWGCASPSCSRLYQNCFTGEGLNPHLRRFQSHGLPLLQYKHFREYSNFPIVLVGATANRLEISIAVCMGSIYVSKLLVLDLSLRFHASDNIIRLARIFKALAHCRVDLRKYYDRVAKFLPPKLSCLIRRQSTSRKRCCPSLSTGSLYPELVNLLQVLWAWGPRPPPYTLLPSLTPTRRLLSSLPRVMTKRLITYLPMPS
jgi:hypothetical protein